MFINIVVVRDITPLYKKILILFFPHILPKIFNFKKIFYNKSLTTLSRIPTASIFAIVAYQSKKISYVPHYLYKWHLNTDVYLQHSPK